MADAVPPVSLAEATRVWWRIGLHSFGGPAAQIALIHRVLVEERKWIGEKRFLHALNFCMLLPGPEAMQLATYVGWMMHGVRGGLIAGGLFVLPGFVAILGLSLAYAHFQDTGWVDAVFFGLKAAVLAVVFLAVFRLGRRALKRRSALVVAASAFFAIFLWDVPFPIIIVVAGLVGWMMAGHRSNDALDAEGAAPGVPRERPVSSRPAATARTIFVWLLVWWSPVLLLVAVFGVGHIFVQEAWFFSGAAVVTFGGAYAVLGYVAQRAVEDFAWLTPGQMLDGLGMAESTPGPLIMVVQFVGFMGAFHSPGPFSPLVAGVLASIVVTWVTFAPCFLWIFAGAPYIERVQGDSRLAAALDGITAAVVGVMLHLAVWFALHVLFGRLRVTEPGAGVSVLVPVVASVDLAALGIMLAAGVVLSRMPRALLPVLGVAVFVGVLLRFGGL